MTNNSKISVIKRIPLLIFRVYWGSVRKFFSISPYSRNLADAMATSVNLTEARELWMVLHLHLKALSGSHWNHFRSSSWSHLSTGCAILGYTQNWKNKNPQQVVLMTIASKLKVWTSPGCVKISCAVICRDDCLLWGRGSLLWGGCNKM